MKPAAITGIGVLTPLVRDFSTMHTNLSTSGWNRSSHTVTDLPLPEGQSSRELRRLSKLAWMAAVAADRALDKTIDRSKMGLGVALTHGSTSYLLEFHDLLFSYGPDSASPAAFSNGVTNAPLSTISNLFQITGSGMTFVGPENTGLDILDHAFFAVKEQQLDSFLVGAAEEYSAVVESVYHRLEWYKSEPPPFLPFPVEPGFGFGVGEGAACLLLEPLSEKNTPRAICSYSPVNTLTVDTLSDIDCVISGAGAGPQDVYEFELLENALDICRTRGQNPHVVFTKPFFGECFALGSMLSSVVACEMIKNKTIYPSFARHPILPNLPSGQPKSDRILVLAAGRNGQTSCGIFSRITDIMYET